MRPQTHKLHTGRTVTALVRTNYEILLENSGKLIEKTIGLNYTIVIRFFADCKSLAKNPESGFCKGTSHREETQVEGLV
jgi:hypothetical protein